VLEKQNALKGIPQWAKEKFNDEPSPYYSFFFD